jgi:alkylation response protein AidB-like acyl-CoA dehydrogenase
MSASASIQLDPHETCSFDKWISDIKSFTPIIKAAHQEIDAQRCLTDDLLSELHNLGLFRLSLPRSLNGGELSPYQLSQVAEVLAQADASVGWCFGQGSGCAMSAAFLEPKISKKVFGPKNSVLAWGAGIAGKAVRCDGGYKITGTWQFASGSGHATWLGGHSMVFDANDVPVLKANGTQADRTALFPKPLATLHDDWHVIGLKGTRSESYTVKELFVPEELTLDRENQDECRSKAPLYIFPTTLVYASCFSGVALGIARGAVDDLIDIARTKTQRSARSSMRESPVFQTQVAQLEGQLSSARAYQQNVLERVSNTVFQTYDLQQSDRAEIRLATTYAINQATEVVQQVYKLAGSSAIFESAPFERRFRDMHAVSQQMQARHSHFETVGRYMMNLDSSSAHM